jgi:hypothetical protein
LPNWNARDLQLDLRFVLDFIKELAVSEADPSYRWLQEPA